MTTTLTRANGKVPALATLAERINEQHRACEHAMNAGLRHALECGRLLIEVKGEVGHGEWIPWLEKNCEFSKRTAQAYMRVATQYPRLNGKAQRVALLTFRGAVAAVASNSTTLANVPEQVQTEALNLWEDKNCKNSHQAVHQAEMANLYREPVASKIEHRVRPEAASGLRDDREIPTEDPIAELVDQFVGACNDLLGMIEQETGGIPDDHPTRPALEQIRDALSKLSEWLDRVDAEPATAEAAA